MSVFKKAIALIVGDTKEVASDLQMPKKRHLKTLTERELLQLESEIGARLFGEIPKGHRREFFCLDANTWIWHEEWTDPQTKKPQQTTTRYEVSDKGVLKVLEGPRYSYLEGAELENLAMATQLYYEQTARQIYKRDPATGRKLV
ncbi:MAG TPA: hypothetical protein VJ841_01635 [Candidatus Saccharimonadales bacterium]|nr:hypothetical protein [Candidatus Saccharimonadales bacterium]